MTAAAETGVRRLIRRDTAEAPALRAEDLAEALALNSPELAHEVYAVVQREALAEQDRLRRLEAKAYSLLAAAGLSVTVMLGFAASSVAPRLVLLPPGWRYAALAVVLVAAGCGLVAAGYAVRALRVSGEYLATSERAIFNRAFLRQCDEQEDVEPGSGVATYRRSFSVDLWEIVRVQQSVNDTKAEHIGDAQLCYMAFLVGLAVTSFFVIVTSTP